MPIVNAADPFRPELYANHPAITASVGAQIITQGLTASDPFFEIFLGIMGVLILCQRYNPPRTK